MDNVQIDTQGDVALAQKQQLATPKLYAVVMHNDNYTTMDFVVYVLMEIFAHDEAAAVRLMLQIHEQGQAIVAKLPFEIAEMKADEVTELAEEENFPLLTTVEPLA